MNAKNDKNLQTCDPGCGNDLKYKCKDGYTYGGYGRCLSPCKSGYTNSYAPTCNGKTASDYYLREDKHSYCVKCGTLTCASGTYATQNECQKHVPTLKCFDSTYTGACKKGSISGCWKPFQTARSHVMMSCSAGTCNVRYCLSTNSSNSGYYGSACVKFLHTNTTYWNSSTSYFNYPGGAIVSCSITTTRMSGENCAGTSASASDFCKAEKELSKSPYELDDGKW